MEQDRKDTARWRAANPDRAQAQGREDGHRRRVIIAGGIVEKFSSIEIFERDNYICGICDEVIDPLLSYPDPRSVSLDHIIAVANGGHHTRINVQAAHLRCNQAKGNRW